MLLLLYLTNEEFAEEVALKKKIYKLRFLSGGTYDFKDNLEALNYIIPYYFIAIKHNIIWVHYYL